MARVYDNWERLVWATLRREELRLTAERTPSDISSSSSSPFGFNGASYRQVLSFNFSSLLLVVGEAFEYNQILCATDYFNESRLIKHGHSGSLYHGFLKDNTQIVVKRICLSSFEKELFLISELQAFGKLLHSRLVPLLGHCLENGNDKFLVYKYMPNKDLSSSLLFKEIVSDDNSRLPSLDWITRLKIAIGVAEGLCYLHHDCAPPLVHRDVQASSILLDDKFEVRLGSLSAVCAQGWNIHHSRISKLQLPNKHLGKRVLIIEEHAVKPFKKILSPFIGTYLQSHCSSLTPGGYVFQTSKQGTSGTLSVTCAYDVYCFGKVLLELVTGKLGISGSSHTAIKDWLAQISPFINIYEKDLVTRIVDPSLIIDEDLLEEVWAIAVVAKFCLNPKPSGRPLMRYILKALKNPLKAVREEHTSSARFRTISTRSSWNAALFGHQQAYKWKVGVA